MTLSDLVQGSHLGSRIGLRPAKQCIFLHLENSGGLGSQPRLCLAPFRDPMADFQWVPLPQPSRLLKAWCLKPKQCDLQLFCCCLVFCFSFFFLFFWNMVLETKHFSLKLGGLPWHLCLLSEAHESLHTNSGMSPCSPRPGWPPSPTAACVCPPHPAH